MSKQLVPLQKNPRLAVTVETEATIGAVLGVNLFNPDGSLVTAAQFAAGSTGSTFTLNVAYALFVPLTRTISTTAPLTGGGALSSNLTIAFQNQSANLVFAGPNTGAAAYPTFRTLVEADTTLSDITTNNATTARHGYLKKLSNVATEYMDGTGNWSVPSGGGGITALTGDVTASGSGSVAATIANDAVTYAKMQNVSAASKLLGRGASGGSGDVEEITLGSNLSMSGTTLNASGGGGGNLTYINTATVTGSAATTISMSGLDLTADQHYLIHFVLDNATASAATISLYYNSDTTAGNYYNVYNSASGVAPTSVRANDGTIFFMTASETLTGRIDIQNDFDGKPRALSAVNRAAPSGIILQFFAHAWTSATNVTGITLSSSVASSFAVGSFFQVYKIEP